MLLAGSNAIVYGAGGAIGGGVARAFAAEGARVRLLAQLDQMRMTRRSPRLADIARVAVFLASDRAAA